jgi:hypothetical protein
LSLNLSLSSSFSPPHPPLPPSVASSSGLGRIKFNVNAVNLLVVSSAAQLQPPASMQCSFHRADQTLKNYTRKKIKNKNNHNNKEKKPSGGSIYKLPVFSAPALNAPVFAVISPGRATSEFLRSARQLSHHTSVRPVDAIAEPPPSTPSTTSSTCTFFISIHPYPSALLFARG